jgi:hypothetical protein
MSQVCKTCVFWWPKAGKEPGSTGKCNRWTVPGNEYRTEPYATCGCWSETNRVEEKPSQPVAEIDLVKQLGQASFELKVEQATNKSLKKDIDKLKAELDECRAHKSRLLEKIAEKDKAQDSVESDLKVLRDRQARDFSQLEYLDRKLRDAYDKVTEQENTIATLRLREMCPLNGEPVAYCIAMTDPSDTKVHSLSFDKAALQKVVTEHGGRIEPLYRIK